MALFRALFIFFVCAAGLGGLETKHLRDHGLYNTVLYSHLLRCTFNKSLNLDVDLLKLYMYDFENDINSTYYLNESAASILNDVNFDRNRTTLLYVPGFNVNINSPNQEVVRQNLKEVPNSYLYIIDHSNYTNVGDSVLEYLSSYKRSVKYYYDIGIAIAKFLEELVDGGVSLEKVYVMGHSLGGQIIGAVGEVYYNRTGKLLPRLLGADPAGPCFSKADTQFQLRSGLAEHVETYHCDAGQLGTDKDLTDAYYYPNGGKAQPGCNNPVAPEVVLTARASLCSHSTCPYILTLPARYSGIWDAIPCNSYKNYIAGDCADNGTSTAGIFSYANNTGKYYFDTDGYKILKYQEL